MAVSVSVLFLTLRLISEIKFKKQVHSFSDKAFIDGLFLNPYREVASPWIWIFLLPALYAILYFFGQCRIQSLRKQPSYIYYLWFSLNLATFASMCALKISPCIISICILMLTGIMYLWPQRPCAISSENRYAPGARGLSEDAFDFEQSAREYAGQIQQDDEDFSVRIINGGYGWGKSSYARMVVESLENIFTKNHFLYTYIALSETNEEKDFSRLFSERWVNTLNRRYPILPVRSATAMLHPLLREVSSGGIRRFIDEINPINIGLARTRKRNTNPQNDLNPIDYISSSCARLFANIPVISEKIWVIVIDEVERSPLQEIFRLIEMMERLKHEARAGLPIKIVFLVCIAKSQLKERIKRMRNVEFARLVDDYFFNDLKTAIKEKPIPYVSDSKRKQYIVDFLKSVSTARPITSTPAILNTLDKQGNYEDNDESRVLRASIDRIKDESPRLIDRILLEFKEQWLVRYRTKEMKEDYIWSGDLLTMAHINVCHPNGMTFLQRTIHKVLPEKDSRIDIAIEQQTIVANFKNIQGWYKAIIREDITKTEEASLSTVWGSWAEIFVQTGDSYSHRLSDPRNMWEYLYYLDEVSRLNWARTNREIYLAQQRENHLPMELGIFELISYSSYLENTQADVSHQIQVIKAIINLLKQRKENPRPFFETEKVSAVNAILDRMEQIVRLNVDTHSIATMLGTMPKDILENTDNSVRLVFIRNLLFQRENIIQALPNVVAKNHLKEAILKCMNDISHQYFNTEKNVYLQESHPFVVLSGLWNGEDENLKMVRKIAQRGLTPEVIDRYWGLYPDISPTGRNILGALSDTGQQIYMPIDELIGITMNLESIDNKTRDKATLWKALLQDNPAVKLKLANAVKKDNSLRVAILNELEKTLS